MRRPKGLPELWRSSKPQPLDHPGAPDAPYPSLPRVRGAWMGLGEGRGARRRARSTHRRFRTTMSHQEATQSCPSVSIPRRVSSRRRGVAAWSPSRPRGRRARPPPPRGTLLPGCGRAAAGVRWLAAPPTPRAPICAGDASVPGLWLAVHDFLSTLFYTCVCVCARAPRAELK